MVAKLLVKLPGALLPARYPTTEAIVLAVSRLTAGSGSKSENNGAPGGPGAGARSLEPLARSADENSQPRSSEPAHRRRLRKPARSRRDRPHRRNGHGRRYRGYHGTDPGHG